MGGASIRITVQVPFIRKKREREKVCYGLSTPRTLQKYTDFENHTPRNALWQYSQYPEMKVKKEHKDGEMDESGMGYRFTMEYDPGIEART